MFKMDQNLITKRRVCGVDDLDACHEFDLNDLSREVLTVAYDSWGPLFSTSLSMINLMISI